MPRALLSVYDRTGVVDLGRVLARPRCELRPTVAHTTGRRRRRVLERDPGVAGALRLPPPRAMTPVVAGWVKPASPGARGAPAADAPRAWPGAVTAVRREPAPGRGAVPPHRRAGLVGRRG